MVGSVGFEAITGQPGTPADEADVGISCERHRRALRNATLDDYTGELQDASRCASPTG